MRKLEETGKCIQGHLVEGENLITVKNGNGTIRKRCRICRLLSQKIYRSKHKEELKLRRCLK